MRSLIESLILGGVFVATTAIALWSQAPAQKPSFEVASVKAASGNSLPRILGQPGGRLTVTNATLKLLMTVAYGMRDFQILGGPNWITTDRWNIEAKAAEGTLYPPPDGTDLYPITLMVQSLIEDRFQLKMRRGTRELPVYELLIARSGSKMKLSEDQSLPPFLQPGDSKPRGLIAVRRGSLEGQGVRLASFVQILSQQLARTVIDKTDLNGLYDIKLQWTPDLDQGAASRVPDTPLPVTDAPFPSIFTAIQEQLGLRLESAKGPVEVLVIDSVQKPSEN